MAEIGRGASGKSSFNAVVMNTIENEKVFEGIVFSVAKRLDIAGAGMVDIVVETTTTADFLVFLPVAFKAFLAGPIEIDFYVGTNADEDGTILDSGNRDNTSANTADVVFRLNPTINNVGTKTPFEFTIFSNGTPASSVLGGESKEGQVFNAIKNTKYMFRLTNTEAGTAAKAHISSNWFEVVV